MLGLAVQKINSVTQTKLIQFCTCWLGFDPNYRKKIIKNSGLDWVGSVWVHGITRTREHP